MCSNKLKFSFLDTFQTVVRKDVTQHHGQRTISDAWRWREDARAEVTEALLLQELDPYLLTQDNLFSLHPNYLARDVDM